MQNEDEKPFMKKIFGRILFSGNFYYLSPLIQMSLKGKMGRQKKRTTIFSSSPM